MDRVPQEVLRWLHGVLQTGYRDVNAAYYDVANALGQFPQLRTNTEEYVFENGRPALLVRLYGSIPAAYRGTTYAYPVTIWIPHEYPAWPPISYVNASQGLSVRPNQHISADGKIYHPYFGEGWQPGRSNIVGILNALVEIFSREPPLVARSNAPPVPPIPGGPGRSESLHSGTVNAPSPLQNAGPALPPKPGQDRPQSIVSPMSPSTGLQGPPPRPPKPGEAPYGQTTGLQGSNQSRMPSMQPVSPQSPQGFYQGAPPQHSWQQYAQTQRQSGHWPEGGPSQSYRATPPILQQQQQQQPPARQALQPGQPQPQMQYSQPYQQRPPSAAQPNTNQSQHPQQWQQQHQCPPQPHQQQKRALTQPPEDLLTSPFDVPLPTHPSQSSLPAPPIPPNPEKDALLSALTSTLSSSLQSTISSTTSALSPLRSQHAALTSALSSLQHEHAHLRSLEAQVLANESTLHNSLEEADRVIADVKKREVPSIDETLISPSVLSRQVYELVAEERACVASREVLGRALERGRVGAEVWVRACRGVGREEWVRKWLVRRAAVGMGLQGVRMQMGADDGKEVVSGDGGEEAGFYYTG